MQIGFLIPKSRNSTASEELTTKIIHDIDDKTKPTIKSNITFYEKNDKLFGELAFTNKLTNRKGESRKSQYLRYLIENDKICSNLEKGLLLTVEYCGTQNKAYARFYDLEEKSIKFWIDNTEHKPYCLHKSKKTLLKV